jgi:predicted DCC family thiol-disulfide oxidoreductase YuxK
MENSARTRSLLKLILRSLIVCLAAASIFYAFYLDRTITSMYQGRSLPFLNGLIKNIDRAPLPYYVDRARLLFSRLILLCVFLHLIAAAAVARRYVKRILVDFFTSGTSPVNLALFRIAVFLAVLLDLRVDASTAIWFSGVSHEMRIAPFGVKWLMPFLPFSRPLAVVGIVLLGIVCAMGILGLFSRTSALLASALSFYVLGILQFSGKVSHDHHLIWFLAILAVSPCGDALSVDAIFAGIRRARQGDLAPLSSSIVYALPLRFASLLLGVVYFFPGFWKFWNSGLDWTFSENLKYQMYAKWMEFNGWTPFFRLDRHPWLYQSAAFFALLFEVSFIFLILFPRLRPLAALGGVVFHFASWLFMRIFFYDLLICYVALFDWSSWLKQLGLKLFPSQLRVFYDGSCRLCRSTIALIRASDVLDCITFINSRDDAGTGRQELLRSIRAVSGDNAFVGFSAYRAMAIRIPIVWALVPFLALPSVQRAGDRVYRRISSTRTCAPAVETAPPLYGSSASMRTMAAISILGTFLLAANIYCGARQISSGWPFACYPTFSSVLGAEMNSFDVAAFDSAGESFPLTTDLSQLLTGQRFQGLMGSLLRMRRVDQGGFNRHMNALCEIYAQQDPRIASIRVYRVRLCTIPESRYLNPLQRDLLYEMAR